MDGCTDGMAALVIITSEIIIITSAIILYIKDYLIIIILCY